MWDTSQNPASTLAKFALTGHSLKSQGNAAALLLAVAAPHLPVGRYSRLSDGLRGGLPLSGGPPLWFGTIDRLSTELPDCQLSTPCGCKTERTLIASTMCPDDLISCV